MRMSVFTGVHIPSLPYLHEAYDSLRSQTYTEWEWVLVPNSGAVIPDDIASDPRVRIYPLDEKVVGIGQIKLFACRHARGEVFAEMDADDILVPDCLEQLASTFSDPLVQFAYSNDVEFHHGTWKPNTYSEYFGWQSRPFMYDGHDLIENIAWEPCPQMLRFVYWAPDHIRAWRQSAYNAVGGHNPNMSVGDDHDLLVRTYLTYGARGMRHIDRPLYLYRIHDSNTVKMRNADIQAATMQIALSGTQSLAERWSHDEGLRLIDLGGGLNGASGYDTIDLRTGADIQADLNEDWPIEDSSVGVLRASHVLEHLRNPIHAMNEAFRVLAPGGFFLIEVPSTDGRGAFQDPTHVSFWNQNSFWYYTEQQYASFIPSYSGRFQASIVTTHFPDAWWKDNNIPVVRADLIALKAPYDVRPPGGALI